MYFMSTACGRPQGGGGSSPSGQGGGGRKPDFFVDVINGWPLIAYCFIVIMKNTDMGLGPTLAHQ